MLNVVIVCVCVRIFAQVELCMLTIRETVVVYLCAARELVGCCVW